MTPIRILHASDLHIAYDPWRRSYLDRLTDDGKLFTTKPDFRTITGLRDALADLIENVSSHDPDVLEQLADFIRQETEDNRLNGIILTGDLATTGEIEDVLKVDEFLNEEPDEECEHRGKYHFSPTLKFAKSRMQGMGFFPGNHDRFVPTYKWTRIWGPVFGPKVFDVNGTNIDLVRYGGDPSTNALPVSTFRAAGMMPNGKVLSVFVLTVDMTLGNFDEHDGWYGWIAQGKAHGKALKTLEDYTNLIKTNYPDPHTRRIIWACHFPPEFPGESGFNKLLDAGDLIESADKMGIPIILTGHTHYPINYDRPSMNVKVLCCGTTTQFEPNSMPGGTSALDPNKGNHFLILEFTGNAEGEIYLIVQKYRYVPTVLNDQFQVTSGPTQNETNWQPVSVTNPMVLPPT